MTRNEYDQLLAAASDATRRLNLQTGGAGAAPVVEHNPRDATVGAVQVQAGGGQRFLVRVTTRRSRLVDEDNLCEKFVVDLLRYAGVIPDDAPGTTKIEVAQEKTRKGQEEVVTLEVYELPY